MQISLLLVSLTNITSFILAGSVLNVCYLTFHLNCGGVEEVNGECSSPVNAHLLAQGRPVKDRVHMLTTLAVNLFLLALAGEEPPHICWADLDTIKHNMSALWILWPGSTAVIRGAPTQLQRREDSETAASEPNLSSSWSFIDAQ